MSKVVYANSDWPEEENSHFVVTNVKPGESDEAALERAKSLYSSNLVMYIGKEGEEGAEEW